MEMNALDKIDHVLVEQLVLHQLIVNLCLEEVVCIGVEAIFQIKTTSSFLYINNDISYMNIYGFLTKMHH